MKFSQRRGVLAAGGCFRRPFRSPFRSCEMKGGLRNGTRVPRRQLRNQLRNGVWVPKMGILRLWRFRNPFRSCEMRWGATKWHSCAKGVFRSCENFHKRGYRLRNNFATKGHFRSQPLILQRGPCVWEIILQQMVNFAGASLRLSQTSEFFLLLSSSLLPETF